MSDFASPTGIEWHSPHVGTVQYGGGDKSQVVMFYNKAIHSPIKSTDSGRPVYEDKVYVRIHPPGERLNIIDREANESDFRRFPQQYGAFRQNKDQVPGGTPIELLYPEYPSIAAMLRANGIMTVEMCAELSGNAIDNIGMGAQRYVNEAIRFLEMSNRGVTASQFRHELEDRDRQIRVQAKQIADLQEMVGHLTKNNLAGAKLQEVQQLIAGVMGRPEHPHGGIDPQQAMIDANHTTAQVSRRRPVPAPREEPAPSKRRRTPLKA